jgi:hypothetical protein
MEDVIQIVGAVLILIGFIAAQRGAMSPQSVVYLVLNLIGSAILAVLAAMDSDWGFLLLETVWAIVSAGALIELARGREPQPRT